MIKHIWNIIWNERKHNVGLWIELLLVAIALWYIIGNMYVALRNYYKPMGFDIEHTYIMHLGLLNSNSAEYAGEIPAETRVEQLRTALQRIQNNPMIEAASISLHSSPHIGSNRSVPLFRDTLQTQYATLDRTITPDFFKVFKYKSKNGSTDELVRALERNELVISPEVEKDLFPNGESAVGKQISFEKGDSADLYRVGAISSEIRYDNFNNWSTYFAQNLVNEFLAVFSGNYVSTLEFCVRVKPDEDHDFIRRFRQDMTQQLRLGNYYLGDIQSIPANKKAFQKDNVNDLQMLAFVVVFLLINIFLGITGIFWFRTQYRRGEIGLRISLGDTPAQILKKYYIEGLLLLSAAMLPAMIVVFLLGQKGILFSSMGDFTVGNYLVGFVITYILLALMILLGIWFPARKAIKVPPAEALRNE